MNNQNFCILCAKHQRDPLTNIKLGELGEGVVVEVECCQGCERILHNVRRVFFEKKKKWLEVMKVQAQQRLDSQSKLIK